MKGTGRMIKCMEKESSITNKEKLLTKGHFKRIGFMGLVIYMALR